MRNPLTDTWASREADAFAARGSLRDTWQAARARGDLGLGAAALGQLESPEHEVELCGSSLGIALTRLEQAGREEGNKRKGAFVVLMTDGANNRGVLTPEQATEIAKRHERDGR